MKQTIANIRSAFNDSRRFANQTSNSGIVEFTHAVREIANDYYDELQIVSGEGTMQVYKFIQKKMNEMRWTGYQFENKTNATT